MLHTPRDVSQHWHLPGLLPAQAPRDAAQKPPRDGFSLAATAYYGVQLAAPRDAQSIGPGSAGAPRDAQSIGPGSAGAPRDAQSIGPGSAGAPRDAHGLPTTAVRFPTPRPAGASTTLRLPPAPVRCHQRHGLAGTLHVAAPRPVGTDAPSPSLPTASSHSTAAVHPPGTWPSRRKGCPHCGSSLSWPTHRSHYDVTCPTCVMMSCHITPHRVPHPQLHLFPCSPSRHAEAMHTPMLLSALPTDGRTTGHGAASEALAIPAHRVDDYWLATAKAHPDVCGVVVVSRAQHVVALLPRHLQACTAPSRAR
jgi:hypothetical protein